MTNSEKMDTMNLVEKATFLHDFYVNHTHITVADFQNWLSEEYIEPIKLSTAEYLILKNIDKEFKYIVRDKDGELFLFKQMPMKQLSSEAENNFWVGGVGNYECTFEMYNHLFKFISFDNSNPYLIEDLLSIEYFDNKGQI